MALLPCMLVVKCFLVILQSWLQWAVGQFLTVVPCKLEVGYFLVNMQWGYQGAVGLFLAFLSYVEDLLGVVRYYLVRGGQ